MWETHANPLYFTIHSKNILPKMDAYTVPKNILHQNLQKIEGIEHHNLFFDCAFDAHAAEIYDQPAWPQHPLFYLCCPSKTDQSVAPEGQENLFFLM